MSTKSWFEDLDERNYIPKGPERGNIKVMDMEVQEIFQDPHSDKDSIQEKISFLGFKEYLSKNYRKKTGWKPDIEIYYKDSSFLLIIDWVHVEYELYYQILGESFL